MDSSDSDSDNQQDPTSTQSTPSVIDTESSTINTQQVTDNEVDPPNPDGPRPTQTKRKLNIKKVAVFGIGGLVAVGLLGILAYTLFTTGFSPTSLLGCSPDVTAELTTHTTTLNDASVTYIQLTEPTNANTVRITHEPTGTTQTVSSLGDTVGFNLNTKPSPDEFTVTGDYDCGTVELNTILQ